MSQKERIYVIGFMGSGKSTAGKSLAKKLGMEFTDLDSVIEETEGLKVREIFNTKGEDYFREKEASCLRALGKKKNIVVSCGGGTPCFHQNMDYMSSDGTVVYLKMSPAALASRLSSDRGQRPLIKGVAPADLPAFIEEKLSSREIYYLKAHVIADGLSPCIDSIAEMIRKLPTSEPTL
jgi:shikimate kinase